MARGYAELKERQRAERAGYPDGLALRVHRALSWLRRAEACEDLDGRFIFLWIAFNAAYANDIAEARRTNERKAFDKFLDELVKVDRSKVLYQLLWSEFSGPIRNLLNSQYVYEPFWDFHRGKISEAEWKSSFERNIRAANRALKNERTAVVLSIALSRMYTLRNQLIHGGATWNSAVNREQLRVCEAFLGKLVPYIIELMMDNPTGAWGEVCYPVIGD